MAPAHPHQQIIVELRVRIVGALDKAGESIVELYFRSLPCNRGAIGVCGTAR
jgi:hypothetical protein